MVHFKENYIFQGSRGSNIFQGGGGVQLFLEWGVQMLIYRFSKGGEPLNPPLDPSMSLKGVTVMNCFSY